MAIGAAGLGLFAFSDRPTFSYSEAPSDVVLFVQASASSVGSTTSITLYGDGRLELHRKRWRTGEDRRTSRYLGPQEMLELMERVVEYRLPEWDPTRIAAEQMKQSGGFSGSFDGTTVTVMISLREYGRGSWSTTNLRKTIEYANPDTAADSYPEIREFQGLTYLWRYLREELQRPPEAQ
ncbi:MAG: hypothetical protein K8I65_08110 [Thermoanaerobaculia bacterium]|nr:hypothetical protein [Thermoanaerobaculia bacterium]